MAWIESHDDIWEHHKTVRLCRILGISDVEAVGHLTSLWHFVLRNAWRDADLAPWGDEGIERASRWTGKVGAWVKALREVVYLDGTIAHGWSERAGKLVQDRLYNEERRKNVDLRRKTDATVPNPTQPNRTEPTDNSFEEFWKVYPRKVAKGQALKSWSKITMSPTLLSVIVSSVLVHKKSDQWSKDGGQFIPHPATWLNQKRWEDEVKINVHSNKGGAAPVEGKYAH